MQKRHDALLVSVNLDQLYGYAGEGRQMPPAPAAASEPLPTDADGMEAYNSQMSSFFSKLSLDACEFCGRTFKPESLVKHLKGCKGPAKRK